jgi:hypothetical protein
LEICSAGFQQQKEERRYHRFGPEKYDKKIHEGDIVFMKTHMDNTPFGRLEHVSLRRGRWRRYLISKKISVLGTDGAELKNRGA